MLRRNARIAILVSAAALFALGGLYGVERLFPRVFHGRTMSLIGGIPTSDRSRAAVARVAPLLEKALAEKGLSLGAPLYIRIFKATSSLEVWVQGAGGGKYSLFRAYPVQRFSGDLGPKTREGDCQAPEGCYSVTRQRMNPLSRFHLSFDVGYPNDFDRALGRTGSAIMVHGGAASIGCFAMGDAAIEELYTLAESSLRAGQDSIPAHIYPFPLTDSELASRAASPHADFWRNLKEGYDYFETNHVPPMVEIRDGKYAFSAPVSD